MRKWVLAALLLVSACGPNAADKAEKKEDAGAKPGVALSAEEIKSLGITMVAARAANFRHQVSGYGTVTALDAIAQADADTRTAAAAAAQSAAAAARAQALGSGDEAAVSREIVEAAQSKAAGDQAALLLARRKAQAVFGVNAPFRDASDRAALVERLSKGKSVLVRVTFPIGSLRNRAPASLSIARLGDGAKSWPN